ncbi:hypothetical protein Poli38472_002281 [Pythium oligandrum]|uniref:Peptidase M14 domain-containing protein n=1 Tax=Pythium oligandrum TaxID=41045 RepID=A0A8K1CHI9_PYTOL|nr:hypothetical protein Poli38472_002281 [Pythium oligandrum]|eukprot:TMW63340.1 hypothetical protein Poli38472_002281 [Pythium oligandrum]
MTEATSSNDRVTLRNVATVAAFTVSAARPALIRRWSRKAVQSTPPPLPLISLPPDDDWEEFDVPTRTGFGYSLPDMGLEKEEPVDTSATSSPSTSTGLQRQQRQFEMLHDRPRICRLLSDYMAQNENFQVRRHGFGIDTRLVYKRQKSTMAASQVRSGSNESENASNGNGSDRAMLADEADLQFNAFFESGNLDRAYRVLGRHYTSTNDLLGTTSTDAGPSMPTSTANAIPFPFFVKVDMEYDLYCDTDISTHGHIQWYFFRVQFPLTILKPRNTSHVAPKAVKVRFNIRNMLKKSSLYNDGMLPAVYVDGPDGAFRGWHHAGVNVCYFKNAETYRNRKTGKVQNYYTLSFVYEFQESPIEFNADEDQPVKTQSWYFAHCYPYTYSRLQRFLLTLQKDPERNRYFRRRVLCKTIAGNICDVLTITDFSQEDDSRTGIVLTARVHPGESNSSFIMHGIIDFLTGPSLEARYLRHRFVFKVVPMLNPDGVIHGNYRCSLAGTDLNRRYVNPSPELHPTIHATKNMVLSLRKSRVISLYCDIHGHSRKRNIFLYGCLPYDETSRSEAAKLRMFPHVLCKTCNASTGGYFSLADCTFSVSKSKRGTGRVVVWNEGQVLHSVTLEASFFGVGVNRKSHRYQNAPSNGGLITPNLEFAATHFMPSDLRQAGVKLCLALIPFAHLLDLDRPAGSPSTASLVTTEEPSSLTDTSPTVGVESPSSIKRCFSPITRPSVPENDDQPSPTRLTGTFHRTESKLRLAPIQLTTASPAPITPLQLHGDTLSSPFFTSPSRISPRPADPLKGFGAVFGDGDLAALFSGVSSPEDLLREIEDALPENLQNGSDDDESPGSESDPSGDNMEDEELQRQESWKNVLTPPPQTTEEPSPPKLLVKSRTLKLMKRFSDSQVGSHMNEALLANQAPLEAENPPEPSLPPTKQTAREPPKTPNPVMLAPIRKSVIPSSYKLRQGAHNSGHGPDRNRDIASLHRRAVQRRNKSRRISHRLVLNEDDF